MRITKKLLKSWCACKDEIEAFTKTFPRGTAITKKSLEKAAKAALDIDWLVTNGAVIRSKNYNRQVLPFYLKWCEKTDPARRKFLSCLVTVEPGSAQWEAGYVQFNKNIQGASIEYYLAVLPIVYRYLKKYGYTDD